MVPTVVSAGTFFAFMHLRLRSNRIKAPSVIPFVPFVAVHSIRSMIRAATRALAIVASRVAALSRASMVTGIGRPLNHSLRKVPLPTGFAAPHGVMKKRWPTATESHYDRHILLWNYGPALTCRRETNSTQADYISVACREVCLCVHETIVDNSLGSVNNYLGSKVYNSLSKLFCHCGHTVIPLPP